MWRRVVGGAWTPVVQEAHVTSSSVRLRPKLTTKCWQFTVLRWKCMYDYKLDTFRGERYAVIKWVNPPVSLLSRERRQASLFPLRPGKSRRKNT